MSGVRAELVFESANNCPVANVSTAADGPVTEISWTASGNGTVTEQFTAAECDLDQNGYSETVEEVFDYGSQQVYEFDQTRGDSCICKHIEQSVGPVTEAYASDGDLHVTLHTANVDHLRDLLAELKERFGRVRVEYLVQGRTDDEDSEIVPVNLSMLTDRQREVLETAHDLGYFEYPREANASEVAEVLDIRPSTFTEHLNAAQSKLLQELLLRS